MKVSLDYKASAKQIPPPGEATLAYFKQEMKTTQKPPPRQMLVVQWKVAHMDGIPADQYDKAMIYDNIMIVEDMLWKLRQVMASCNTPCVCSQCQTQYPADPNEGTSQGACPSCGSFQFDVDTDFLIGSNPKVQLAADTNDKGQPICKITAYIKAA